MIEIFYYWCCIKWIILKIGKWKKNVFLNMNMKYLDMVLGYLLLIE